MTQVTVLRTADKATATDRSGEQHYVVEVTDRSANDYHKIGDMLVWSASMMEVGSKKK